MAPAAPLYSPKPGRLGSIDSFREYVNARQRLDLSSYDELHAFSVAQVNDFWMSLWEYLDIEASVQPGVAVDESVSIDQLPKFFQSARLNFAENMLSRTGDGAAVKVINEENLWEPVSVSWDELRELVKVYADSLRASGIQQGDVVVVIGGNDITSLTLLLATAAVGGLFSSFATDAGEQALSDRIGQLNPRFLFASSLYSYSGKKHDISNRVTNVFNRISKHASAEIICTTSTTPIPNTWTPLSAFLSRSQSPSTPLTFLQVPFSHPLVIMFSSGTTGTPKGIVHSHGGLTLNGKKEHCLHNDFDAKDTYFHYSGIGWTLWNIMLGALSCGTTLVLYDGSPFHPSPETCLGAILATGVTAFGAGPRYFAELQKVNIKPRRYAQKVNLLLSTGAVLTPALSAWLAEAFGPVCQIGFSGGTELCGSFVHGLRTLPTYAGEITVKALGMDVDVYTPSGTSAEVGQSGELVCRRGFPNMPVCFWNDPDGKRYHDAYFAVFPRVWTHGDFVRVNPDTGGWYVLGRSDGVLNPSEVRFGSSEIYAVLERHFQGRVLDALCVGQRREGKGEVGERVFLFVKLADNDEDGDMHGLEGEIRQRIKVDLSPRHVPSFVFAVRDIPFNANGKKLEIPVKAILSKGEEALSKGKFSGEEKAVLRTYLPFFEVVEMMAGGLGVRKSKL